ncbi:hypothetical protein IU11_06290 [Cellulosimicrobium sp. MM]|nr:hypothetical protein IU11_06290 [Cellulosimicrobium sp. MM]
MSSVTGSPSMSARSSDARPVAVREDARDAGPADPLVHVYPQPRSRSATIPAVRCSANASSGCRWRSV